MYSRNFWFPEVFNDFFDHNAMTPARATAPAINVLETPTAYRVELAAPGMRKEDFNININQDGNLSNTRSRILQKDRRNIILSSNKDKLVAIRGLEDCIVIDTDDVLLICPRDDRQYKELITGTGMPGFDEYR